MSVKQIEVGTYWEEDLTKTISILTRPWVTEWTHRALEEVLISPEMLGYRLLFRRWETDTAIYVRPFWFWLLLRTREFYKSLYWGTLRLAFRARIFHHHALPSVRVRWRDFRPGPAVFCLRCANEELRWRTQ